MTLSKQLYGIIAFIFIMIFVGNFVLSINNFREYLEIESTTKSQDTATSLGMTLKSLIDNKTDPEIEATIKAIANRGFYRELRLENSELTFTKKDILNASDIKVNYSINDVIKNRDKDLSYNIKDLTINKTDGEIIVETNNDDLESQLSDLDDTPLDDNIAPSNDNTIYSFVPTKTFKSKKLTIKFTAYNDLGSTDITAQVDVNRVLVSVSRDEKFDSVPQWFIDFLPMKMVEKKSEISNGWKTQAIIYVSANAGEAYSKLYIQAKSAIYYAIVAFVISFGLLIIFLQFILKPLTKIESLAKAISQGDFQTIEKLPWTLELKNVSISMNDMSNKIKNMITKLNRNLEKMTEQLSQDDLTGLQLEQTFQTDMKQMFIKKQDGYVFSIKIADLADFAKNNPNNVVNKFFKDFAQILKNSSKDSSAYRFYGSVFTMIVKNGNHSEIETIVANLKISFNKLSKEYNKKCIAHIGVTPFNPISTTDDILAAANEAYSLAKQIGDNEAHIRDKNDLAKDMLAWKELITDIIDNSKFKVGYINQAISTDGNKTLLTEEAFSDIFDKDGKVIPIGTFVSVAEEYNKVIDFDKAIIKQVIKDIISKNIKHEILINLAFDSLMNNEFKSWLENILMSNQTIASQLIFSVTAYGCARDIDTFKEFITLVHKKGGKIILKRFETKFIPLDTIKEFNLDYIRLARDYTKDIATDANKQNFVDSVCELSKLLNIKVFAESIKTDDDFNKLNSLGIFGASK